MSGSAGDRRIVLVMPRLNLTAHLVRAIDAFLAQHSREKRLVVVDGRSTDGSHEIIASRASEFPEIVWGGEQDTGISSALNIAMGEVRDSDCWEYLGADDVLTSCAHG